MTNELKTEIEKLLLDQLREANTPGSKMKAIDKKRILDTAIKYEIAKQAKNPGGESWGSGFTAKARLNNPN